MEQERLRWLCPRKSARSWDQSADQHDDWRQQQEEEEDDDNDGKSP